MKKNPLVLIVLISMSACASPPPAVPTATQPPTPRSTNTPLPMATAIPGFEEWSVFGVQNVDIAVENNALILTLKHRALWFMEQRGVLMYQMAEGNFMITADVYTSKSSDLTQPPGRDGSVQLGGLMARNGNPGRENYVFIVVGDDGDGLSVETKNTVESLSKYKGPAWASPDAELRLCRFGSTFNLYKRLIGSSEAWSLADSFDRPDLPESLQVGVNIYTDSAPDLQIRYENIKIEAISDASECER